MRRGLVALGLCFVMIFSGCSTAWAGQAEEIVAALIPAAGNIVALAALLQGKSVSAEDLQTIQQAGAQVGADLQLVQTLISQYEKADASVQPGILNQIEAAIGTAQGNLNSILPALHIKDAATQGKIAAVVGLVISEVEALAAVIPLVRSASEAPTPSTGSGQALAAKSAARVGHPQSSHGSSAKVPLSGAEFAASFNRVMTARTGNLELDRVTAGLGIHSHGKVVRVLTAGALR